VRWLVREYAAWLRLLLRSGLGRARR
jgi:hypothetical protein